MKRKIGVFILLVSLCVPMWSFTVVLDAGHGGDDPGAIGRIAREKDLNLKAVMQLGEMIKEA